jgi:hypothetical protein
VKGSSGGGQTKYEVASYLNPPKWDVVKDYGPFACEFFGKRVRGGGLTSGGEGMRGTEVVSSPLAAIARLQCVRRPMSLGIRFIARGGHVGERLPPPFPCE